MTNYEQVSYYSLDLSKNERLFENGGQFTSIEEKIKKRKKDETPKESIAVLTLIPQAPNNTSDIPEEDHEFPEEEEDMDESVMEVNMLLDLMILKHQGSDGDTRLTGRIVVKPSA
jgi:hypothetical protein